jgi:fructokinase
MKHRIGVDLGGTKIEVCVLNPHGAIVHRERAPTPKSGYDAILGALAELVLKAQNTLQLDPQTPVGVGIPGAVSPSSGLIKNSNTLCLIGRPLDKDLEERLARPVRLANDANCFALSEAMDGAAKNQASVFGVIVGTGCGGGLVFEKQIIVGRNAIAGEWGHCALPWPTIEEWTREICYCGRKLCNELFLSGTGIQKDHWLRSKEKKTVQEIVEGFRSGDAAACETIEVFFDRMSRALSQVMNLFDPSVIILGGGVSNISELYEEIPKGLTKYVFTDSIETPILPAQYGDSSGVRGAAWLF